MDEKRKELCLYRLEKVKECLNSARVLGQSDDMERKMTE